LYEFQNSKWNKLDGKSGPGKHITIGADGEKWYVNSSGAVFRMLPSAKEWSPMGKPGDKLKSIHCTSSKGNYVVGVGDGVGNQQLYRWNGRGWDALYQSSGTHIAITYGYMWHVEASGDVFQASITK
jgi:hypothetical protein